MAIPAVASRARQSTVRLLFFFYSRFSWFLQILLEWMTCGTIQSLCFYMRLFRIRSSVVTFISNTGCVLIFCKCLRPKLPNTLVLPRQGTTYHHCPTIYSISRTFYSAKHAEESKLFGMLSTKCAEIQRWGK